MSSLDPVASNDSPSDTTSLGLPLSPTVHTSLLTFTSVAVSRSDIAPSDLTLPPIKRQRTDDTLASLLSLSPPPALLSATLLEPLDSLLALPVPSATVTPVEADESTEQHRSRRRDDKRRRRRREAVEEAAAGGVDDDYQPMAGVGQGEDDDDEMTLLMDDMQRVEGEEEDELRALQADAEVDIEQLRQQMRQAEADGAEEDEDEEEEESGEEEGSEYSDEDDEDRVDINDLPRLKDLHSLQRTAAAAGLPPPTSLLDPASLNVPFAPKERVEIVRSSEETITTTTIGEEEKMKVESGATGGGEEVKVEEVTMRQLVTQPVVSELTVTSVTVRETSQEQEEKQVEAEVAKAEEKAVEKVELADVTDRERILSQELSISVAELRAMDRQYHEEREANLQRRKERRQREQQTAVDTVDDGYSTSSSSSSFASSSSSSDSDDSDNDDYYESYSSSVTTTTTVTYPPPHISPYPAKTSRVGHAYQAYPLPSELPTIEAKAAECVLHLTEEGELVVLSSGDVERTAPDGHVYWEVAELRRRRREMRDEMARKRLEQQAATAATEVAVAEVGGVDGEVDVQPTVVRSQRSSARRAREFIASTAASSSGNSENGTKAALSVMNEVREVMEAVVDAVAVGGETELSGSSGGVSAAGSARISVLT